MYETFRELQNEVLSKALLDSGTQFFRAISQAIRQASGAQLVVVGSLKIAEAERVEVLGYSSEGQLVEITSYDACPAPCLEVLNKNEITIYTDNLDGLFPGDPVIQAIGAKSYIGFPLRNAQGSVVGLATLEWTSPLKAGEADTLIADLKPLIARIETEVVEHNVAHAFEALLNPIVDDPELSDTAIFRTIVQQAAAVAQVHGAVLTKCVDRDAKHFRILAAAADDNLLTDAEGTLMAYNGTPCNNLKVNETFFQERDLQANYPDIALFRDLNTEAYCGFGFRDREGSPIGHLAFLHNRPMSRRMLDCRIVNVVASRAGQEIQRYFMETERESLREALAVRKKLESLGLMAGTIAHDFNNQLTAMIGNTELAMLDLEPTHPATPYIKLAEESMWRARDVIGELMDFAGNTPTRPPSLINLNEILRREVSSLEQDLPEELGIECTLDESLPPILGHHTQLHRIVGNLTLNAIDALQGQNGQISISTAMSPVSREERERCLTGHTRNLPEVAIALEISDSGPGMNAEAAERAFDPFFSSKGISRGLGLSGALGIAHRFPMGLTFSSAPEMGTRFRLYFEQASPTGSQFSDHAEFSTEPSRESLGSILVVDDQPDVLRTVVQLLKSLGYQPIEATSGEDALHVAESASHLDAALIDIVMPGIDGWTTLETLRKRWPDLPAIMMTGYSEMDPTVQRSSLIGIDVLSKPFNLDTLKSALRSLARHKNSGS